MPSAVTGGPSRGTLARVAGAWYLSFIAASVVADVLGHIGMGDAEDVYDAITNHPSSFRLGLVVAFTSAFAFLIAAWGLYVLLRDVGPNLALLFLLLNAVGVAVQCASMLQLVSALLIGDGSSGAAPFDPAQQAGLAHLAIDGYRQGFVIAQLFFGTWLFPLGYLVYRSGFLPRFLGVLLLLDGVAEGVWFLQTLLLPGHPGLTVPGTVVSFAAEVGLTGWLLIRGARDPDAASLGSAETR